MTKHAMQCHLPFGFGTCQFFRKLDPVKLTVQVVVNRAFRTSRCVPFPFSSPLSSLKQCVEWFPKESYISANCQFFFLSFFIPALGLLLFWNLCIWLLPFCLSSGCPRWRLACTCHATCAVAAARSREHHQSSHQHHGQPLPASTSTDDAERSNRDVDGGRRGGEKALIHVMGVNVSLFMALSVWYLAADGGEQ